MNIYKIHKLYTFLKVFHPLQEEKKNCHLSKERDYYSTNVSILNISPYSAIETCFEMLKSVEHEKL